MAFRDGRLIPRGDALEADICVIGAGAAGLTLALELNNLQTSVVILESGGFESEADTQALYAGTTIGQSYTSLDRCRTRFFGGSTNCWNGFCSRLGAMDFAERDWIPQSGWPFGLEEIEPYYARAEQVCQLPSRGDETSGSAELDPQPLPFDSRAVVTKMFNRKPTRFGEVYREEMERSKNVEVLLHSNAVSIETGRTSLEVERIRAATLSGNEFSIKAKFYVLATGGIENPRLLLNSDAQVRGGLGNDHDLVGRYFMEHPHVFESDCLLLSDRTQSIALYEGERLVHGCLALSGQSMEKERVASFGAWIFPTLREKAQLTPWGPLAEAVAAMDERSHPRPAVPRLASLYCQAEQTPNRDSRITLGGELDALGLRKSVLDWRMHDYDLWSLRRSLEVVGEELAYARLGRLRGEPPVLSPEWPRGLSIGNHHMGTTRMHRDPSLGVVDENCRVHGVANLFIAGSSVFPTGGAVNPTLTIVALAIRLADHLKGGPA